MIAEIPQRISCRFSMKTEITRDQPRAPGADAAVEPRTTLTATTATTRHAPLRPTGSEARALP
jgi:hypothetical protein